MSAPLKTSASDLDGFRLAQRVAYSCAARVEAALTPGMTERDAAAMLRARLSEIGVTHYFHVPFAWFGDRTALADDWSDDEFLPSDRALTPGMPVILDVAPIVSGYACDIGYSFAFGHNAVMNRMLDDLAEVRRAIPLALKEGRNLAQTYRKVDAIIAKQGYDNRHRAYPFNVLGHRVARFTPAAGDEQIAGAFGASALGFIRDGVRAAKKEPHQSPLWNKDSEPSRVPPTGVWAVEPHVGKNGVGAKFEELLVITETDAYWLDNDLPHVRRWNPRTLVQSEPRSTTTRAVTW